MNLRMFWFYLLGVSIFFILLPEFTDSLRIYLIFSPLGLLGLISSFVGLFMTRRQGTVQSPRAIGSWRLAGSIAVAIEFFAAILFNISLVFVMGWDSYGPFSAEEKSILWQSCLLTLLPPILAIIGIRKDRWWGYAALGVPFLEILALYFQFSI